MEAVAVITLGIDIHTNLRRNVETPRALVDARSIQIGRILFVHRTQFGCHIRTDIPVVVHIITAKSTKRNLEGRLLLIGRQTCRRRKREGFAPYITVVGMKRGKHTGCPLGSNLIARIQVHTPNTELVRIVVLTDRRIHLPV